ncbi:MAG TPA: ABC transporter ATP-binding protein [Candidatus Thermoplasmatota archaeon]|nr:ABC transporter ATP-binding protein [Candidatus Thermoplasmatota archaeon]
MVFEAPWRDRARKEGRGPRQWWARLSGPAGPTQAPPPASAPRADEPPGAPLKEQLRRAFVFVRPDRNVVMGVLSLTLVVAALNAAEPLVLKYIFDELTAGSAVRALMAGVAMLLVLHVAREGLVAWSNWLTWRIRLRVHHRLLESTVGRLHSLPLTFHREQSVGGLMTRLDRGISGYLGAFTEVAFNILPSLMYLGLALVFMFQLDWRLSLLVLFFAPIPALIGAWAAKEQTDRDRTLMDRWSKIYSRFNEVLSGIVVVKSFAMEDVEKKRFLTDVRSANDVVVKGVGRDSAFGAARSFVSVLARIGAIALGGWLVLQGQTTVGTVVAFLGYVGGVFGPVQGLTGTYQTLRRARVSLDVIFGILDAQDTLGDAPDAVELQRVRGDVTFEDVGFSYKQGQVILRKIDLDVKAGEVVAIVGPSGSGKTTLMALLQRLYDPERGSIKVDGLDLRQVKQKSLRTQVGVVMQDAAMFNDTVRNVIAYGRPSASQQEVEEAAKAACAHEFIMNLPQGYDTLVGERAAKFSGGERQRLAIARALLKDPAILILDEATSALDAESEAMVQEALDRLVRGRTTFIIAHRLSTVVNADRIVVLRDGRVLETGTHRELVQAGGYYASLVRHQTKGLLWEPGTPIVR